MNEQIFEAVVTTQSPAGVPHVAPMGIRYRTLADGSSAVVLMPFKPSTTLSNLLATGVAVLNQVLDGRVYAGCVTGRVNRDLQGHPAWALRPATRVAGQVLASALSHLELSLLRCDDDPQRPVLWLQPVHSATQAPFPGLNRAQAAVLEGAVLVSRLHLLPADKVAREMAYLQIAIDKTAGAAEHEAWSWLLEALAQAPGHAATAGPAAEPAPRPPSPPGSAARTASLAQGEA